VPHVTVVSQVSDPCLFIPGSVSMKMRFFEFVLFYMCCIGVF